jgi:hypothetical protein
VPDHQRVKIFPSLLRCARHDGDCPLAFCLLTR